MGKSDYTKQMQEKEQEAFRKIAELAETFERSPEEIAEYLAFSSRFYTYSPRNVMLILKQNPGATFVDSYGGWQKREAHVLKGQHGLNILVPVTVTFLVDGENWTQLSKASDELKERAKLGEVETKQKMFYKAGTVFDISQTDYPKENYPALFFMGYKSEHHEKICQGIVDYAVKELGCEVREADLKSIALRGRYVKSTPPVIELNERLESTQKLSTLTHELGHALLHKRNSDTSTAQKEFEADAFSIMLSSNYGIELTDTRKNHLADNVRAFKKEILAGTDSESPEQQKLWNENLYKSFGTVYTMYRECIDKIEKYINIHLSKEVLIKAEQEAAIPKMDVVMKNEQITELVLFCMNNEGVPELDRLYETLSENIRANYPLENNVEIEKQLV